MSVHHRIAFVAGAIGAFVIVSPASAQTRWNEIPAPTGKEALSRSYPEGYRTDVIDVPIRGNDGELEYKIQMKAGGTVVYSWFYEKGTGAKASGALTAPWEGIHGWYWQNQSAGPVVVRLRIAGFYELVPGQAGRPVQE